MKSTKENEKKYKKLSCPNCDSEKIIKRRLRKTENRGEIQRYSCKECSHRFIIDDGFFRMRNYPKKITCALDLFYRGFNKKSPRTFQSILSLQFIT